MPKAMTALQLVERVTSRPGYTQSLGTSVVTAEPGRVQLAVDRRADFLQFGGNFHGGIISGLADSAAGAAITTSLPTGRIAVTIDLHMTFLSPASGTRLIAKAEAIRVGSTVSVAKVEVESQQDGESRLCAFGTVTLRAVDIPEGISSQQ